MNKTTIDRLKTELDSRFRRLVEWLNENGLDYAVILKEEIEVQSGNYLYYGGALMSGEYGAIVVDSSGERSAIVHEYSFERVRNSWLYSGVFEIRQSIEELIATLRKLVKDSNTAIDSSATQNATNLLRSSGINMSDKNLREFVFSQRATKSEFEVHEMETAIGIAKRALDRTVHSFKSGITTEDISRSLNKNILDEGGIGTSFETDVRIIRGLSEAQTRKLAKGDLVLFDFGAKLSSMYLSDVGRTIPFLPDRDHKIRDFMNDVYSIKRAGFKKIRKWTHWKSSPCRNRSSNS